MHMKRIPAHPLFDVRPLLEAGNSVVHHVPPAGVPPVAAPGLTLSVPEGDAQYWTTLWRAKWFVAALGLVGAAAGIVVALFSTPIYKTRASIELQMINENYLNIQGLEPTAVNYGSDTYMQTQLSVLGSDALLERSVAKLRAKVPEKVLAAPVPSNAFLARYRLVKPKPEDRDTAIGYVASHLEVKGSGLTRLVDIRCESPYPQLAADFANTLTNEYIEQSLEARWNSTQRTAEWLTKKQKELKAKLETAENALQSYAQSSGLMFMGEKEDLAEGALRRLEAELSAAHNERIQKQSRYEQSVHSPAEALPEVLDSGVLRDYQSRISELQRQLAEASTIYQPEHSKVVRLRAQLTEMQDQHRRELRNILGRITSEYQVAERRETMLMEAEAKQRRIAGEQLGKETRYNLLKREVDSTRQMYDSVLQKMKEVGVAGAMPVTNVRVIDTAKAPVMPASPSAKLNAALGGLLGGFAGIVLAFARGRGDRQVTAPGQLSALLGVPELGIVPSAHVDLLHRKWPASIWRALKRSENDEAGPVPMADVPISHRAHSVELATAGYANSLLAEAYRSALPSLLFGMELGTTRVVVVTSANPGEGKTSVVSNLGIALAELNKRVLIIDGDLRRPRMHQIFEVDNSAGLKDLLMAEESKKTATVPAATSVPNLYVLPAGAPSMPDAPSVLAPDGAIAAGLPRTIRYYSRGHRTRVADERCASAWAARRRRHDGSSGPWQYAPRPLCRGRTVPGRWHTRNGRDPERPGPQVRHFGSLRTGIPESLRALLHQLDRPAANSYAQSAETQHLHSDVQPGSVHSTASGAETEPARGGPANHRGLSLRETVSADYGVVGWDQ